MKLDIEEILHKSEAICLQIKNCKVRLRGDISFFISTEDRAECRDQVT